MADKQTKIRTTLQTGRLIRATERTPHHGSPHRSSSWSGFLTGSPPRATTQEDSTRVSAPTASTPSRAAITGTRTSRTSSTGTRASTTGTRASTTVTRASTTVTRASAPVTRASQASAQAAPHSFVELPYIPTNCTPERPTRTTTADLDISLHPGDRDSDLELLSPVQPSLQSAQPSGRMSYPPRSPVHRGHRSRSPLSRSPGTIKGKSNLQTSHQGSRSTVSRPSRPRSTVTRPPTSPAAKDFSALQSRLDRLESHLQSSPGHRRSSHRRRHHSARHLSPVQRGTSDSPVPSRTVTVSHRSPHRRSPSPARGRRPPTPEDHNSSPGTRDRSHSSDRRSVFSRLGRQRSASPSPTRRDPETQMDTWKALIDLGLVLSGHKEAPPPTPVSGTGLLAASTSVSSARITFPPSSGVVDSLDRAFKLFSGNRSMEAMETVQPGGMPSDVTLKIPVTKLGASFRAKYHGGDDFPVAMKSNQPTEEESSFLRSGAEPSVSIRKLGDIEHLLRKNTRVLSSLDWLLTTLKEVSSLPHQDASVVDALWAQVQRTLGYATDFSSGALCSTMLSRREAFLRSCDAAKVPRRTHTWATLRPLFPSSSALLGDAAATLRSAAREDREMQLISSLSAASRRTGGSRGSGRQTSSSAAPRYTSQRRPQQPRRSSESAPHSSTGNSSAAPRGRRQPFRGGRGKRAQ